MSRSQPSDARALDGGDPSATATSQQELYGRREPKDLDDGRSSREDAGDATHAKPGRGTDASGQPSTARSGANTQ